MVKNIIDIMVSDDKKTAYCDWEHSTGGIAYVKWRINHKMINTYRFHYEEQGDGFWIGLQQEKSRLQWIYRTATGQWLTPGGKLENYTRTVVRAGDVVKLKFYQGRVWFSVNVGKPVLCFDDHELVWQSVRPFVYLIGETGKVKMLQGSVYNDQSAMIIQPEEFD